MSKSNPFISAEQIAAQHLQELHERTRNWTTVETMLPSLNDRLGGGFTPGVHYLCGSTGISKTAVSLQIARMAAQSGRTVVFVSLELEPGDLLDRIVSQEMGLPWIKVRAGEYNDEAEEVFWGLTDLPLFFPTDSMTSKLKTLMDALYAMDETPFVIVDYLQLAADRYFAKLDIRDRVSEMCKALSLFAKTRRAPVLVISSISRAMYNKMKPTPDSCLAAAKESGQVEYEATSLNVMLPEGDSNDIPRPGYWVVAKNRYGPAGKVKISINGLRGLIEECEDQSDEPVSLGESLDIKILKTLLMPVPVNESGTGKDYWIAENLATHLQKRKQVIQQKTNKMRQKQLITMTSSGLIVLKKGHELLQGKGEVKKDNV